VSHTDLHEEASRLPFVEGSVSSKNGGLPLPLNEPLHCPGMPWPKPETEISTAGEGKAVWLEDHATTNCQLGPFCRLGVWPELCRGYPALVPSCRCLVPSRARLPPHLSLFVGQLVQDQDLKRILNGCPPGGISKCIQDEKIGLQTKDVQRSAHTYLRSAVNE
jgi:hypothetical protein